MSAEIIKSYTVVLGELNMSDEAREEKADVWGKFERALGKELIHVKGRQSWRRSFDNKVSINLVFSKFYPKDNNYWYGLKLEDFQLWESYKKPFVAFVLGQSNEVILIPTTDLYTALTRSNVTTAADGAFKLHILKKNNNFHFTEIEDLSLNPYYNNYDQLNIASASDFEDSEHAVIIKEQKGEFNLKSLSFFGSGGESEAHTCFKEYIASHPELLISNHSDYKAETEFVLPSLDSIDVVLTSETEQIGVEVKSKISSIDDITRGLFQCVKYMALLNAIHKATNPQLKTKVFLVLEGTFPEALQNLKEILEIDVRDKITIQ